MGLLGLLIWGAFWGWRNLTAPLPTPEPTPCVTVTTELVNVSQVSVRVFNGGFTSGLASRVGNRLSDAGFNVIEVDNIDERIREGVIIRANEDNVPGLRLVTSYFQDPIVQYDDRVDGTIDILLASEEPAAGTEPLFQVSSGEGGTACVPPDPTPTVPVEAAPTQEP